MSIAALGMAVAYLLIIVAGAIGAILVVIWLFGETAGAATSTGDKTIRDLRNAGRFGVGSTPSAPDEPERSEDEAA